GIGGSVADNGHASYTQKRSAAVFGIVQTFLEVDKSPAGKQSADLRGDGGAQRFFQENANRFNQAFGNFQSDVADKSIADDDIDAAIVEVAAFHVANEVQRQFLQQGIRMAGKFIALALLFANREQPDRGFFFAKNRAIVHLAHDRKLGDIVRLAIDVGPHIN